MVKQVVTLDNLGDGFTVDVNKKKIEIKFRQDLVGIPFPYPSDVPPDGFLVMKGQAIDASVYPILHRLYGGTLTDLRGEVIRGWDNGRGVDAGRDLLSWQEDAIRNIKGEHYVGNEASKEYATGVYSNTTSSSQGTTDLRRSLISLSRTRDVVVFDASAVVPTANENRMRNVAFNYICLAG